jgi:LysM repeat protein
MSRTEQIVAIVIIAVGFVLGGFLGYLFILRPVTETPVAVRAVDTPAVDTPTPPMLPLPPTPSYTIYVVQTGDNLWTIANRFDTTAEAIMELNGLSSTLIYSGTQLYIPGGETQVLSLVITATPSDGPTRQPPTMTPSDTATPQPPKSTPSSTASGTMTVDNWEIRVERIETANTITSPYSDYPYIAAGRFALVFMAVTNRGLRPDTFVAFGTVEIEDGEGRRYDADFVVSSIAQSTYNTDIGTDIDPDATKHIVAAFDISRQSASYRLVPGSLADSYTGSIALNIP